MAYLDFDEGYRDEEYADSCNDCKKLNKKFNDLRDAMTDVVKALTSDDKLDLIELDSTLNFICDELGVDMGYKPINIERRSQSLKMLNDYLQNMKK